MKTKLAGMGGAPAQTYVDDVFSTTLYTGNGSTQTITNGIDLAGKGGMVWAKQRSSTQNHFLFDTLRGVNKYLQSTNISSQGTVTNTLPAFNSNGFDVGSNGPNTNATTYASWTFRKAAKFFDVVTYTGNGTLLTVNHNLGSTPGMIIVKRTDGAGAWNVYHRGLTAYNYYLLLNTTDAQANGSNTWGAAPTSTTFTVGNAGGGDNGVNGTGNTYVAYLFAHDTSSTGIIQCGTFTTDASGNATVNLGWEPQYLMNKKSSNIDNWQIYDQMRGFNATGATSALLRANTVDEEYVGVDIHPTATGFNTVGFAVSSTYIYMAIRRPNKPPTTGTQVFNAIARTGTGADTSYSTGISADLVTSFNRAGGYRLPFVDRLRGFSKQLLTDLPNAEGTNTVGVIGIGNTSVSLGVDTSFFYWNESGANYINYAFKRAPGFFDEVCYTGTGVTRTVAHNLTVVPELIIVKNRSNVNNWPTYSAYVVQEAQYRINLNSTEGSSPSGESVWGATPTTVPNMTSTTFSLGSEGKVNTSLYTYVAYLFATLAGISKVGSYTGNGTGQAIACGFSAGARFVLIRRTDSGGNWFTFDSARGLTSGSSPYLLLNTTGAEVTGNNGVYASTGGFTLGSTASTTTNINGASYIYLSVA